MAGKKQYKFRFMVAIEAKKIIRKEKAENYYSDQVKELTSDDLLVIFDIYPEALKRVEEMEARKKEAHKQQKQAESL